MNVMPTINPLNSGKPKEILFRNPQRQSRAKLTLEQMNIIIGSILGDGAVEKNGAFAEEHSIKQSQYLSWKQDKLQNLCATKSKITKHGTAIRFRTRAIFQDLREIWYGTGRKALPNNFENLINPQVLAVWYMDDGDKKKSTHKGVFVDYLADNGMRISIANFNRKEAARIVDVFSSYGIKSVYKREGKYLRLCIPASDGNSKKFAQLILPYMEQSMLYKIPAFRPSERGKHWAIKRQMKTDGSEGVETKQGAVNVD
jgi:hypothetical protein